MAASRSSPLFEFRESDIQDFRSLVREMQRETGRPLKTIIRNTGRDFTRKAIAYTAIAPTVTMQSWKMVRQRHTRQWIAVPVSPPQQQRISRRGFAKLGWMPALRGLRMAPSAGLRLYATRGGRIGASLGDFRNGLNRADPFVEIANNNPYIVELDRGSRSNPPYHIGARAMLQARFVMQRALTRMSRRMARRWR